MVRENDLGQPIGEPMAPDWLPPELPPHAVMEGCAVRLEPLEAKAHCDDLWDALQKDVTGAGWTYMLCGPFESKGALESWLENASNTKGQLYFACTDNMSGRAAGWASYLRINAPHGSVEVGSIRFAPDLQQTIASTEAMYLMMKAAFNLGYRRYEWKCDALNAPSCRAAERLGSTYEGTFRQMSHYKDRNRDTAWYSILDSEWPQVCAAFESWLDLGNFDDIGRQRSSLSDFMVRGSSQV